ncbi:MAG: FG-GAP repeat domain-containing protein [Myxococcota bacterium]
MRLSLLVVLAACGIDNNLGTHKDDPGGDDDTGGGPGTDTSGTDTNDDTDEDGECDPPELDGRSVDPYDDCDAEAITGTFTPVVEWTNTAVGDAYVTPVVGQLTDDNGNGRIDAGDVPDIVVSNAVGVTYAVSGDGGAVHWSAGSLGSEPMTAAIGDLDGDGFPEVVASGPSGTEAYRGQDGRVFWRASAYSGNVSAQCGAVGIYDLDADGQPEVVLGRRILNGLDGSTIGEGRGGDGSGHGWAAPISAAADIDQDGDLEVVVGNALYDKSGATIWSNRGADGYVAIANFDSDNKGEIVVTGLGSVRLQDDDGSILWTQSGITGSTTGTPTVADFDGDGEAEIGVAGMGQYVVLEADGSRKWAVTTNDYSSGFTGSAVFDFEGDGAAEVVYADENDLLVFDGATGAIKLRESAHSSATCSETPAIADVDNDGHAEIIYTSSAYSGAERGVTVVGDADDSWMAGRPVWNQHAYDITHVEDDGGIPSPGDTNWLTYNNFRSGDLVSATGGVLADAVTLLNDVCNVECEDGRLRVTVIVANKGMGEIPAGIAVSAYALQSGQAVYLTTKYTTEAIPSGESTTGIVFDVDPADVLDGELWFTADDDDGSAALTECHEDNNTLVVDDNLCP